jgi:hypothetical protein
MAPIACSSWRLFLVVAGILINQDVSGIQALECVVRHISSVAETEKSCALTLFKDGIVGFMHSRISYLKKTISETVKNYVKFDSWAHVSLQMFSSHKQN